MIEMVMPASGGVVESGLFAQAERKMGWIDARQRVLASNIANVDTPGYLARDVAPFDSQLSVFGVSLSRTDPSHFAGSVVPVAGTHVVASEAAPDGNAVTLEDQLTKVADDQSAQALVGNLWKSYMGMYMTALGHGS